MILIQLVDASRLPAEIDGYAIHRLNEVRFVVRDDLSPQRLAAAVGRLGASMDRETIDAARTARTTATE